MSHTLLSRFRPTNLSFNISVVPRIYVNSRLTMADFSSPSHSIFILMRDQLSQMGHPCRSTAYARNPNLRQIPPVSTYGIQGPNEVPSSYMDFSFAQVTFHVRLLGAQGPRHACLLTKLGLRDKK